MQFIEGKTLSDHVKDKGKLDEKEAVDILQKIAQALSYAHKKGVIHRDIKPGNIMLDKSGLPRLLDFGLARMGVDSELSVSGVFMGTRHYASPEQMRDAKKVDHRSDIYALGATLYFMLSGDSPKVIRSDKIPAGLASVIFKCMEEDPADRYFSVDEMLTDLSDVVGAGNFSLSKKGKVTRPSEPLDREPSSFQKSKLNIGQCPECGEDNPSDIRFCQGCGKSLWRKCPACEKDVSVNVVNCGRCGVHLKNRERALSMVEEGRKLQQEKKLGEALKIIEEAFKLDSLERGKNTIEAGATFKEVSEAYLQCGELMEEGQEEEEKKNYESACDLYGRALLMYPTWEELQGHYQRAEDLWFKELLGRAQNFEGRKLLEQALHRYKQAMSLKESSEASEIADLQKKTEELQRTIEYANQYFASAEKHRTEYKFDLAKQELNLALEQNDDEKYRSLLGEIKETERQIEDLKERTSARAKEGEYLKALSLCREALLLNPISMDLQEIQNKVKQAGHAHYLEEGEKHSREEDLGEAESCFEKALECEVVEETGKQLAGIRGLKKRRAALQGRVFSLLPQGKVESALRFLKSEESKEIGEKFRSLKIIEIEGLIQEGKNHYSEFSRLLGSHSIPEALTCLEKALDANPEWSSVQSQKQELEENWEKVQKTLSLAKKAVQASNWPAARSLYKEIQSSGLISQREIEANLQKAKREIKKARIILGLKIGIPIFLILFLIVGIVYNRYKAEEDLYQRAVKADGGLKDMADYARAISAYQRYLNAYSNGKYVTAARNRVTELKNKFEELAPTLNSFTYLRNATYSAGGATNTVHEYRHDRTGLEFVLVPGGSFQMGSTEWSDSQPVHSVTLKPFLMGKTEVTQKAYEKIMGTNPSNWKGDNLPVEKVSWNDAKEFCQKVGATGRSPLQLPTEAQWEYACRAGTTTKYYWGSSMDGDYAWYGGNSGSKTHDVAQKKPNAFGLYDMAGNVWEWCEDSWNSNYNGAPNDGTAYLDTSSVRSVLRGGSWYNYLVYFFASAFRADSTSDDRYVTDGFRVVVRLRDH